MKAIQFNFTIPRYLFGIVIRKYFPSLLWSGLSCTYLTEIPELITPGKEWLQIRTRLGGICGTDLGAIHLHVSTYNEPFHSFPLTLGHENVGHISEIGSETGDWEPGERVVVEPLLWCVPRGFRNLCRFCARGEINRCERITRGDVAAGIMTGFCRDTGGSWSPTFLAHSSQLYRVPSEISDENAMMIEPFSVGLHAVLQNMPSDDETALIIGSGSIGLYTLAAIRALGSRARVIVLARYPFQAQAAEKLGASQVVLGEDNDYLAEISNLTQAKILKPALGKRVVMGGADLTYECVGHDTSIDDALQLTKPGGKVVLVGVPGVVKRLDWSPVMIKELQVSASLNYNHIEEFGGQQWKTFDLAIELMKNGKVDLGWMVTHKFALEEYGSALGMLANRKNEEVIKAVFSFD